MRHFQSFLFILGLLLQLQARTGTAEQKAFIVVKEGLDAYAGQPFTIYWQLDTSNDIEDDATVDITLLACHPPMRAEDLTAYEPVLIIACRFYSYLLNRCSFTWRPLSFSSTLSAFENASASFKSYLSIFAYRVLPFVLELCTPCPDANFIIARTAQLISQILALILCSFP